VIHCAFGRILDRHDTEIGGAAFHFLKDLVDGRERQAPDRMSEVLVNGRLRERALRAEISDFQRILLRQARRHDLAKQPEHLLVAQWTFISLQYRAQDFRLALGTVVVDGRAQVTLGDTHLLRVAGPLADQLLDLAVHLVNAPADARKIGHCLVFFCCFGQAGAPVNL
jgi:hypothetical protein